MDDFSWGNTRVVVGEGKDKIIQMPEDEYFDDSMIPLKKFSGPSGRRCLFQARLRLTSHCFHRLRERGLGEGVAARLGLGRRQRLWLAARQRSAASSSGAH